MKIKIGADPELFVQKNGEFISAHGIIPGTKENPFPVELGAVQVDGVALEFNIEPAERFGVFEHNINTVLHELRKMVPSEYEFVITATADFDPEYMATLPEKVLELGCEPDYNAWTGEVNDPPDQHPSMRTAAGHIHVGWTEDADPHSDEHFTLCREVVREMDALAGVHSILADGNRERRKMYGKAGAFRPKSYGVEYRTLSNYWIANRKDMEMVWRLTLAAMDNVVNEKSILKDVAEGGFNVPEIINNSDVHNAMEVRGRYHVY